MFDMQVHIHLQDGLMNEHTQNEMNIYKELKDQISEASYEKYGKKLYQESFDYEFEQDVNKLNYNFDDVFYHELKLY